MNFTQKETDLLKDLKSHEKLCIEKYTKGEQCAKDPQLKNLFTELKTVEQQHLDTLTQIENGTVPQMQTNSPSPLNDLVFTATYGLNEDTNKQNDCYLCSDSLSTEKHVSGMYNTSIFEFKDTNVRDVLNHIQKEEQEHGKKIYEYMACNSMYN